ncbi:MAG: polysaccharide lyase [Bdellovibrionales bacterium]|nr:polysaccharide lyase [Bdellovibrionales bacterium]
MILFHRAGHWAIIIFSLLLVPIVFNSCGGYESADISSKIQESSSSTNETDQTTPPSGSETAPSGEPEFSPDDQGWLVQRNFNQGTEGEKVELGAGGSSRYSYDVSLDGSMAAKMSIRAGETAFGQWGGILNFDSPLTQGDKVWIQFYIYIPSSFIIETPTNGSLKFIRIRTQTSGGQNGGYNDLQMMDDNTGSNAVYRYIKEGPGARWTSVAQANQRSMLLPRDRWFKVEVALSFDNVPTSDGGKSYFRMWVDDNLIWNGLDVNTLSRPDDLATALYLFTYWNGGAPQDQSLYIDNIIMTSKVPSNTDNQGHAFIGSPQ